MTEFVEVVRMSGWCSGDADCRAPGKECPFTWVDAWNGLFVSAVRDAWRPSLCDPECAAGAGNVGCFEGGRYRRVEELGAGEMGWCDGGCTAGCGLFPMGSIYGSEWEGVGGRRYREGGSLWGDGLECDSAYECGGYYVMSAGWRACDVVDSVIREWGVYDVRVLFPRARRANRQPVF